MNYEYPYVYDNTINVVATTQTFVDVNSVQVIDLGQTVTLTLSSKYRMYIRFNMEDANMAEVVFSLYQSGSSNMKLLGLQFVTGSGITNMFTLVGTIEDHETVFGGSIIGQDVELELIYHNGIRKIMYNGTEYGSDVITTNGTTHHSDISIDQVKLSMAITDQNDPSGYEFKGVIHELTIEYDN